MKDFAFRPQKKKPTKKRKTVTKTFVSMDSNVGIYAIKNDILKTAYVGQSKNISTRIRNHRHNLNNQNYINKAKLSILQNHYNNSAGDFEFVTLYNCEEHELYEWETFYCKKLTEDGYSMYNTFINTEITGLVCPEQFKDIVSRLITLLDSGKLNPEQLEQSIISMESA